MHPVEDIRGTKSGLLANKRIVVGVTGSIAAVECVRLIRELIRHGADVYVVMSKAAQEIVHPYALQFASGNHVITQITGNVEHVWFCGKTQEQADLLLIAPATANTISKVALGIDDTPVTTFATTAIGTGIPVIVVPAMHGTMFDHPVIKKHMKALADMGITVMNPRMEERSAKIPDVDEIVAETIRTVGPRTLENRKVLVISGATEEHIDDMRTISNTSTGSMGIEMAKVAHHLGADVELWLGMRSKPAPVYLPTKSFTDTASLEKMITTLKKVDIAMVPAAIADFRPKTSKGKISSKAPIDLHLTPTPKLLGKIAKKSGFTVGFKAESRVSDDVLKERAISRMKESGANLMVANDLEKVGPDRTEVLIIEGGKDLRVNKMVGTRREVAGAIWERVLECL